MCSERGLKVGCPEEGRCLCRYLRYSTDFGIGTQCQDEARHRSARGIAVVQHTRRQVAHLCCIPLALTHSHLPNTRDSISCARAMPNVHVAGPEEPCSEDDATRYTCIVKIGLDSPPAVLPEGVSIGDTPLGEGGGSGS